MKGSQVLFLELQVISEKRMRQHIIRFFFKFLFIHMILLFLPGFKKKIKKKEGSERKSGSVLGPRAIS